jgi:hypothetical protein
LQFRAGSDYFDPFWDHFGLFYLFQLSSSPCRYRLDHFMPIRSLRAEAK